MRILAVSTVSQTSVVLDGPQLPGLTFGTLSVTDALETFPSATAVLQGVPETELNGLLTSYRVGNEYRINGMQMCVIGTSYVRTPMPVKAINDFSMLRTYNLTVRFEGALKSKYTKNVETKPLFTLLEPGKQEGVISLSKLARTAQCGYQGRDLEILFSSEPGPRDRSSVSTYAQEAARISGGYLKLSGTSVEVRSMNTGATWQFTEEQVIGEGGVATAFLPTFKDTVVNGRFVQDFDEIPDPSDRDDDLVPQSPRVEELIEEDEDFDSPPAGSIVLKDIDSNFDFSGPTKTKRIKQTINGSTVAEQVLVNGFFYTGFDIYNSEIDAMAGDPETYWGRVQDETTSFEYQPLQGLVLSASFTNEGGARIPMIVDDRGASNSNVTVTRNLTGNRIQVKSSIKYLVESRTEGVDKTRYQTEPKDGKNDPRSLAFARNSALFDNAVQAATFDLWSFFDNPVSRVQQYDLKAERGFYSENISSPIQVTRVDVEDVPEELTDQLTDNTIDDGEVIIATPVETYVEPLLVMRELNVQQGFSAVANPRSTAESPLPPYSTGKESFFTVSRTVSVPRSPDEKLNPSQSERFEENITEFSAQDGGFANSLENKRFVEQAGRPPRATTLDTEVKAIKDNNNADSPQGRKAVFLVSSDRQHKFTNSGGSLSFPNAATEQDAKTAVEATLEIETLKIQTAAKTISFNYPNVRAMDHVIVGDTSYRVVRVTHNYRFEGNNHRIPNIGTLAIADGMQVQLGKFTNRTATLRKTFDDIEGNTAGIGDQDITLDSNTEIGLNAIELSTLSRRNN